MNTFFTEKLAAMQVDGVLKSLPILQSANASEVMVNGKSLINFCSNNYLGLTDHPALKRGAIEAIEKYGVGASSARNIIANTDLMEELEALLAQFKGEEAALVCQSGYTCNLGAISGLMESGDVILSDELNHASIIDGMRLCKAAKKIYRHMDLEDVEKFLRENREKYKRALIVTDSVFSMDGDIAPIPGLVALAQRYDAMTYVDDAHATGILGCNGRGSVDYFGLNGQVDFTMGTLSKAIPAVGAYLSGSREMKEYLMRSSRPILFSTGIPPAAMGASIACLKLLMSTTEYVDRLWENTRYFQKHLAELGFDIGSTKTPITPIIIGDEAKTVQFSSKLMERGVLASPIKFPVVPRGKGRVRCIVTAQHTREQMERCLEIFVETAKEMRIL